MKLHEIEAGTFAQAIICGEEHDIYFYNSQSNFLSFVSLTDANLEAYSITKNRMIYGSRHGKPFELRDVKIIQLYPRGATINI